MTRHPYDSDFKAELAMWPGVTCVHERGSKHKVLVISFNGYSRRVVYPCTPGDSIHGVHNCLRDLRKELIRLGAVRVRPEPCTRPARRHSRAKPPATAIQIRSEPTDGVNGPSRDPWAALAGFVVPEATAPAPPEPARRQSWWRALLRRITAWHAKTREMIRP